VRPGWAGLGLLLVALPGGGAETVQVVARESDRRVDILVGGRPFTSYIWPESLTKPVLFPLRTEKGTPVTRGFPLDPRPGERTDHPHHVGLWFNYGDVNGVDFWNNSTTLPPDRQARMGRGRHVRIVSATGGDEEGRLQVLVEWVMPDGSVVLDEATTFGFRKTPGGRLVDRMTTLTARDKAVRFPDNKEGVLGLRVARGLEQPSKEPAIFTDAAGVATTVARLDNTGVTGLYRTSEGKEGDAAWGTRGRWCALSGKLGAEDVTIAILDHPSNPGAPTYWHARGYGLFAANPLGQKALSDGKETLDFSLAPRAAATFRHRVAILSRPFAAGDIDALSKGFASSR
jgi:Methane oxygenase PmoA